MSDCVVEFDGVDKTYPFFELRGVSLQLEAADSRFAGSHGSANRDT
jgi:hypothetical protein